MGEIVKLVARMDPEVAMAEMANALKTLFLSLGEDARSAFLMELIGESQVDKVSSLVHL
jgi:hypothetical protein